MVDRRVVVMGVSGAGKSTVGEQVAGWLGARFVDADELHPPANVQKMAAGLPLDDADRAPWLQRVRDELRGHLSIVATCSALKQTYRDVLREAGDVTFVFLDLGPEVVHDRVATRRDHFMKADMVTSQFAALERPAADERDVHIIDANRPVDEVVAAAVEAIGSERPGDGEP